MNADDLLRRALEALDSESPDIQLRAALEIRAYLETPKDKSVQKRLAIQRGKLSHEDMVAFCVELLDSYDGLVSKLHERVDTNSTASISSEEVDRSRKPPLNGDQILEGFKATGFSDAGLYALRCFTEGVRFAERMRDE